MSAARLISIFASLVIIAVGVWMMFAGDDNSKPDPASPSVAAQGKDADIELYLTMLDVKSAINGPGVCITEKAALDGADTEIATYTDIKRDYDICFEHSLYYHYYRLPFLEEVTKMGEFTKRAKLFNKRLAELDSQFKGNKTVQKLRKDKGL